MVSGNKEGVREKECVSVNTDTEESRVVVAGNERACPDNTELFASARLEGKWERRAWERREGGWRKI